MCGISGFFGYRVSTPEKKILIENIISTIGHRGPDAWGTYISEQVTFGHSRLSIVDLSGGHQPMEDDRFVICFNGEIYNHIELRQELMAKGIKFSTNCDTEVIYKAYGFYGSDCFAKFNGQFAFLLWDKKKRKLIIARDRYGVRPLYILKYQGAYFFSSEMKAFDVIPGYQRKFDMENLFEHALLWNTLDDHTVYQGIRSLPGGTFEIYEEGTTPLHYRFYELGESNGQSPATFSEAKEEFSALLEDAVKLRLRSDVPVGAYLSGGIDSSVTTHLANLFNKEELKTFSVAFEDSDFDESKYQREMVSKISSKHHELKITYKALNETFPETVYHTERPIFRTAPTPLFLLSEEVTKNKIKVVLTGEGADEILWGYDVYKELKILDFWAKQPSSVIRPMLIKKLYPHLHHYNDPKQFGLIKMFYEGFLNDYHNPLVGLNIRIHNNKILENYFHKDHNLQFNKDKLIGQVNALMPANSKNWNLLKKNQFLEMKTLLSGYLLSSQGDRMSMAHGVEGRYPFLDHRLVEKVFYYKDEFKLNGFKQKYLLTESYRGHIPESILARPKMPYMAPDLKSFFHKGKPTEMASYFLSEAKIKDDGIFDYEFVKRFIGKIERLMPEKIGYRDNMLITFMLSTQISNYWMKNPKKHHLNIKNQTVEMLNI